MNITTEFFHELKRTEVASFEREYSCVILDLVINPTG